MAWRSVGDGGARWKTVEASRVGAPSCAGDGRERAGKGEASSRTREGNEEKKRMGRAERRGKAGPK